jgi:hypothetical protein
MEYQIKEERNFKYIEEVVDTYNIIDSINKENFGACIYSDNLYGDKIIGLKLDDIKVSIVNEYTPEDFVESLVNRDRSILDIKNIQLLKHTLEELKTTFEIPGVIRVYEMCN